MAYYNTDIELDVGSGRTVTIKKFRDNDKNILCYYPQFSTTESEYRKMADHLAQLLHVKFYSILCDEYPFNDELACQIGSELNLQYSCLFDTISAEVICEKQDEQKYDVLFTDLIMWFFSAENEAQ